MSHSHLPEEKSLAQRKAVHSQNESTLQAKTPPTFQLKASEGEVTQRKESAGSQGNLPADLVGGFAATTGHDLSDVKVNYNSEKPSQVGALAYAQGNDIHLGAGQEQHLAHEAAHVVQQREGRVQANTQVAGACERQSRPRA